MGCRLINNALVWAIGFPISSDFSEKTALSKKNTVIRIFFILANG